MEYVFYGLLAVAFIAFVVLVIRSYRKKLASGCCGASDESVKKNKVAKVSAIRFRWSSHKNINNNYFLILYRHF